MPGEVGTTAGKWRVARNQQSSLGRMDFSSCRPFRFVHDLTRIEQCVDGPSYAERRRPSIGLPYYSRKSSSCRSNTPVSPGCAAADMGCVVYLTASNCPLSTFLNRESPPLVPISLRMAA